MSKQDWIELAGWVGACFTAAGIGAVWTMSGLQSWYGTLVKPSFTPPNIVFGPVWMLLYLAMGIAAWGVSRGRGFGAAAVPLMLFVIQLALNVLWSGIFFGLKLPGLAFGEIVLLWLAVFFTTIAFWKTLPWAGGLLLPYLAWVTFAGALNFSIWRLNNS